MAPYDDGLVSSSDVQGARDAAARWNGVVPASRPNAWEQVMEDAGSLTDRGARNLVMLGMLGLEAASENLSAFTGSEPLEFSAMDVISPDEANARYGVEGYLRFTEPVFDADAANRAYWAQRQAYREWAVASSELPILDQLGAGLVGSLIDPIQWPLWLGPEGFAGNALRTGLLARGLSPVARGVVAGGLEGALGGALFESVNLPLRRSVGEDYGLAEASVSVLGGALFGSAFGGIAGAFSRSPAPPLDTRVEVAPFQAEPHFADPVGMISGPPDFINRLRPETRVGAAREAIEALAEDRAVDLGPLLRQADEWNGTAVNLARLNEVASPLPASWKPLDPDIAVTTRGEEIPVRYVLAELDDLTTSHDDDLFRDAAYPPELQPRQRERAAAQARNRKLETELNPLRLVDERGAESGAPIVSRDGVVESGNGRVIALRRSARGSGTEAYSRYRALLENRGLDLNGMKQPVLVRVREEPLSGQERARLTRDMNADVTERYSATEQALADAQALDDGLLALIEGGDISHAINRPFQRRFLERIAGDQINSLVAPGGGLSKQGEARIRAALTAKAYGDETLIEALFEDGDDLLKGVGRALADAAPEWAATKSAMARGEVPAELDMTGPLILAVDLVRHARHRRLPVADVVAARLGQLDAFAGEAISVETEAFLRAMFVTARDGSTLWNRPRSADKLSEALQWLARETRKAQPGENLFGEVAGQADVRRLLNGLTDWFAKDAEPDRHPLAVGRETDLAVRAVRPAGRERPGGRGGSETGRGLGEAEAGLDPPPATRIDVGDPFADDPELRELWRDTEAMIRREGLDGTEDGAVQPDDAHMVATAIEAAANCMLDGMD